MRFRLTYELALVAIFCLVAWQGLALADPQGLSASIPVRVKDAINYSELGDFTLYYTDRYTEEQNGDYDLNGGPKLKVGLAPGLAFVTSPAEQISNSRLDKGGLSANAIEYQLNDQNTYFPAVLIEGAYLAPYGADHGPAQKQLLIVTTKYLGSSAQSPRLDLEVTWNDIPFPLKKERKGRLSLGFAYSHLITAKSAFVIDFVHQQLGSVGKDGNFIDCGSNYEFTPAVTAGLGAGIGIAQQAPDFRIFMGLKWSFHAF